MRWPLRAHRRRCHATGLVLWLLTAQLISCSHAWLFALRGAETPSALAPSALTFENAYQSTFHDAPFATAAAEQYDRWAALQRCMQSCCSRPLQPDTCALCFAD